MTQSKKNVLQTKDVIRITKDKLGQEWIKCPSCPMKVRSTNFVNHMKFTHRKRLEIESPPKQMNMKILTLMIVVIILSVSIVGSIILISSLENGQNSNISNKINVNSNNNQTSKNNTNNNASDENPPDNVEINWWDNYTSLYSQGSGENNWWINYPDKHPDSGESVNHLEWIKQNIEKKPILIVVHRAGQPCCEPQAIKAREVANEYPDDLIFHDLDLTTDSDTYDKAYEISIYDPDGEPHLIALTIVLTKIKDNSGKVSIAWHSWEGDMDKLVLESWVRDGIYYYENSKTD